MVILRTRGRRSLCILQHLSPVCSPRTVCPLSSLPLSGRPGATGHPAPITYGPTASSSTAAPTARSANSRKTPRSRPGWLRTELADRLSTEAFFRPRGGPTAGAPPRRLQRRKTAQFHLRIACAEGRPRAGAEGRTRLFAEATRGGPLQAERALSADSAVTGHLRCAPPQTRSSRSLARSPSLPALRRYRAGGGRT